MTINIPNTALIILCGPSSSGKSTFAKNNFLPTEVISSDYCRAMLSDNENDLTVTKEAFELLHFIVAQRLKLNKRVVVDATNIQVDGRKKLFALAKKHHVLTTIIAFDMPSDLIKKRHRNRTDRNFSEQILWKQFQQFKSSLRQFKKEGFKSITVLKGEDQASKALINYRPLYNDLTHEKGPFDIIGDVHGCFDELRELLKNLGYVVRKKSSDSIYGYTVKAPKRRKVIFVGDLTDRGPKSLDVLKLVMRMVKDGTALCVCGNHDAKLLKALSGKNVKLSHGLDLTMEQLENTSEDFKKEVVKFLSKLISHYVLMNGKLVVAHAGIPENMQGRASSTVRSFCLYGDTTGKLNQYNRPERLDWAKDYEGKAMVVYGHVTVAEAHWRNNTINIDTACVFGGQLTALRLPEKELVQVAAKKEYAVLGHPLLDTRKPNLKDEDLININWAQGKKHIATRLGRTVIIDEGKTAAALENISRFAVHPNWLIYLPPTMSPCETSKEAGYLEHPKEAFEYYRKNGVTEVVCQAKHMGSRAIVVLCKEDDVAQKRFKMGLPAKGKCYTRTGRNFFTDKNLENAFLERLRTALTNSGFWDKLDTNWVCLDCELMPWSAKAQGLITGQYASVGASATLAMKTAIPQLELAAKNNEAMVDLLHDYQERSKDIGAYQNAYRAYCAPVNSIDDLVLAPFHIMATEGKVHTDKPHTWHIKTIADFCKTDPSFLLKTKMFSVKLEEQEEVEAVTNWWLKYTKNGGEGMVIKPTNFIVNNAKGLIQPAIKCRGKEYLRIIYGPHYDHPKNLQQLRKRGLGKKRALAYKEFSLGVEGLHQFVENNSFSNTHECVLGVAALETDAVDPRL